LPGCICHRFFIHVVSVAVNHRGNIGGGKRGEKNSCKKRRKKGKKRKEKGGPNTGRIICRY